MNANQIKKVRAMLHKAGLNPYKDEIVLGHSEGRTNSLTAMTDEETQSIIKYLEGELKQPPSLAEKMRNKILSLAHEMKWQYRNAQGKIKVDMDRVNEWCVDKFKYTLDDLPYLELCRAVTAFENVHTSYLRGI